MAKRRSSTTTKPLSEPKSAEKLIPCGLVMPISAIDGLGAHHWAEVKAIVEEAMLKARFEAWLVSESDDSGIIHSRIVQNLYEMPVVVVDVSCKNPNVMFELGMRLAFDKPTIIIKDDKTDYSFDSSPIEHVVYPRDLRYGLINDFKSLLAAKVKATHEKASTDPQYSTFLKHFGTFVPAQMHATEVSREDYIINELRGLREMLSKRDGSPVVTRNSYTKTLLVNGQVLNEDEVLFDDIPLRIRVRHGTTSTIWDGTFCIPESAVGPKLTNQLVIRSADGVMGRVMMTGIRTAGNETTVSFTGLGDLLHPTQM